ncbi:4'-phosphopantetheinyl transferase EntD [Xanthomonas arboricola]|uniref:4'-phosphopantetheinyl transferase family protein n=1 Tax=Xanthomonas TaxID=338 RepID=UPI000CEEBCC2|nr:MULTISPECIES: 4'-phosphopantetheinyl transferase superfamily protein [Xanthomonas]MBB5736246.1 4'-phosphopantetheinyl transferase EntD [Xanthomonas sp. CFBP 8152]PPT74833.1 hypothetical protein XarbCFBP8152_18350 [Xanthomonas arboricola]
MDEFLIDPGYVSWFDPGLSIFKTGFDSAHYAPHLIAEIGAAYGAFIDKAVVKRKSEFVAGRYCAHRSIAAWSPARDRDLIGIGEGRMPLWPSEVTGSISHCQGYSIAMTANARNFRAIGIDVEDIVAPEIRRNIEELVVNGDETPLLGQGEAKGETQDAVFTLIFSVKESFFKAAYPYVRKRFGFEAVSVTFIDWRSRQIFFRINQDIGKSFSRGTVLSACFKTIDRRILTFFGIRRSDEQFAHLDSELAATGRNCGDSFAH